MRILRLHVRNSAYFLAYTICGIIGVLAIRMRMLQKIVTRDSDVYENNFTFEDRLPQYDVKDIFHFTTHNITKMPTIEYLPNLKDACFFVQLNGRRILRCIPKTYIVGFNKCGTSDLGARLHGRYIRLSYLKEPLFWADTRISQNFTLGRYLEVFNHAASMIRHCCLNTQGRGFKIQEEAIMKQDLALQPNERMMYERAHNRTMANSAYTARKCGLIRKRVAKQGHCPLSLLDASPVIAWFLRRSFTYGNPSHQEEDKILTPIKLRQVVPDARFIFMMRDPVQRLLSDYNFYFPYNHPVNMSALHFHKVVVASIAWWRKCVTVLPLDTCLYDYNYDGTVMPSIPQYWQEGVLISGVARLRIGLYALFIKSWLDIFPTQQCLFIRFEDYKNRSEEVLKEQVYPFLGSKPTKAKKTSSTVNKTNYKVHAMLPETEHILKEFYEPFNRELARILNNTAYNWNENS